MARFLISVVVLLAAGAALATPMPPSREKTNALGFHQHQPKSSLHGYTGAAPLVADTTSTNGEPTTGETSIATPAPGPGRIAPPDKTDKTKTPPPPGPGRIEPVNKTRPDPPEFCTTQRIGGPPDLTPWGCAIKGPPKELPEPGTYLLLAVGLLGLCLVRSRRSRVEAARV
jgi:hypothetical protein